MKPRLIFVYNANSSLFSQVTDYVHKIISPKTYQCNLCALTYDNLGMKREWKAFVQSLDADVEFLHKDELTTQYPTLSRFYLPLVLLTKPDKDPQVILSSQQINAVKTLSQLVELIRSKLI